MRKPFLHHSLFRLALLPCVIALCIIPLAQVVRAYDIPITWTTRTPAEAIPWSDSAWSPELGLFAAVTYTGTQRIMTSPDGITWTPHTAPANNVWSAITWSPELGLFVAVARDINQAMTSSDGVNWTTRTLPASGWQDVTWSPELGLFVTVSDQSEALVSSDGINWTIHFIAGGPADWRKVIWSPELGLFVAVSPDATNPNQIMTSPDGVTWTPPTIPVNDTWTNGAWSSELGMFVVMGSTDRILVSSDGVNWTSHNMGLSPRQVTDVIWVSDLREFVAVSNTGTDRTMTSQDGITWSPYPDSDPSSDNRWASISYAPDIHTFVAVAGQADGQLLMSGVPDATVPDAPASLQAVVAGTDTINLSWTAPTNDGGAPISGYRIERRVAGGSFTTLVADTNSTATVYQDIGLNPGTLYTYRVSAINLMGAGIPSNEASATTQQLTPPTPTPSDGGGNGTLAATGDPTGAFILTGITLLVLGTTIFAFRHRRLSPRQ